MRTGTIPIIACTQSRTDMEPTPGPQNPTEETSIFDNLKPLPVLYTDRAIYVFSLLMGLLFGSILMAINVSRMGNKKGVWQVIVYGVLYTALQYVITNTVLHNSNLGLTLGINICGAFLMRKLFWETYIGKDTAYTPRSVLVPGIIAGVIVAIAIVLIIVASKMV